MRVTFLFLFFSISKVFSVGDSYRLVGLDENNSKLVRVDSITGDSAEIAEIVGRNYRIVEENDRLVLVRAGCGNPCWNGYFYDKISGRIFELNNYLGYDLERGYVLSPNFNSGLDIINLQDGEVNHYIKDGCNSAFIGYCIDFVSFSDSYCFFDWYGDTVYGEGIRIRDSIRLK